MTISMQFVDFPKQPIIQDIILSKFEHCLTHLHLAEEIHLSLVFKHVHFTITELSIMVSGDKIHENIHVSGRDVPHTIDKGIKKLESILHKLSDKLKTQHHGGRERRGRGRKNEI